MMIKRVFSAPFRFDFLSRLLCQRFPGQFCGQFSGQSIFQVALQAVLVGLVVLASLCLFVKPAQAQFQTGTIASATGGAGRAAVDAGEVSFLNPAAIAHLQRYYISGQYAFGDHPNEGQFRGYGAQLADGTEGSLIPGAVYYARRNREQVGFPGVTEQDIQITIGQFVHPKVAIGLGVHRLIYQPAGGSEYTQDNAHVGVLFTPTEWLGLGAVAYNVIPASESVPVGVRLVPSFAIGSHVLIYEIFRLRLDLVRPDKFNEGRRTDVMAGFETMFRKEFAFRMGGLWRETADQTYLTMGLGFRGPRLSFDYSFQRDVRTAEASRHLFDMWLPF